MTPPGDDAGPLFRKAEQAHPAGYQNVHVASIHSLCHAAAIFGKKTRFFLIDSFVQWKTHFCDAHNSSRRSLWADLSLPDEIWWA